MNLLTKQLLFIPKGSSDSTFMKMYRYMEDNLNDVMTPDNDEGKDRVLRENGGYAFLMESSSIQYISQRECELTQIGDLLDHKGYGMAMRKGNFEPPVKIMWHQVSLIFQDFPTGIS